LNFRFLLKLLNNIMIDCIELHDQLNFKVYPINSRNKPTIYQLLKVNTKYLLFSPANILMSAGNTY